MRLHRIWKYCVMVCVGGYTSAHAVEPYIFMQNEVQNRSGVWQQYVGNNTNVYTRQHTYGVGFQGEERGFVYHVRSDVLENDATPSDTVQTKRTELDMKTLYRTFDINDTVSVKVGKFTETWQIANGFTPLSIMSPDSRTIASDNKTSVDYSTLGLMAQYYAPSGNSVYTVYVNGDRRVPNPVKGTGYKSVGIKASMYATNTTDITLVAHTYQGAGNVGIGAGVRNVYSDALALYSSVFVRQGTHRAIHRGVLDGNTTFTATTNPVGAYRINDGKKYTNMVLGAQYTTHANYQWWFEISYDQRGMDNTQWKTYKDLVHHYNGLGGRALALRSPNLAWASSLIHDRGLRQKYAWIRLSKDVGDYDFNTSVRMGVDTSALWQTQIVYEGVENTTIAMKLMNTTGRDGTEYGGYFPSQNRIILTLRRDF